MISVCTSHVPHEDTKRGEENLTTDKLDNPIQMLQPFLLEHPRVHIILQMPIVDGKSDSVQTQRSEALGIGLGEEVFEELVEEVKVFLFAEHFEHGGSHFI